MVTYTRQHQKSAHGNFPAVADSAQMVRYCDAVEHDADKLPGKSVGLRFELKDADLYWLQFPDS
jgi:hypothetical protein